jgi:hypothetical protein
MLRHNEHWALDFHIPIATQLRVLLCDADLPMLLTYARAEALDLHVWGPRPSGAKMRTELLFSFDALVASWVPVPGAFEMSIDTFLDTGVAVITLPGEQDGRAYSPRQIIKWVANKEGGAHFSFDRPATLELLKQSVWSSGETHVEAFQVKHVVFGVAEWTHAALGYVLGLIDRGRNVTPAAIAAGWHPGPPPEVT